MADNLQGYRGISREILSKAGAQIGDRIHVKLKIKGGERDLEGLLIPRAENALDEYIVIKLDNGYNIGAHLDTSATITVLGKGSGPRYAKPLSPVWKAGLPKVTVMSTGGTIASRVDYRTGAVEPALTAEDLHALIPEISEIAQINAKILFNIFSENMTPSHWGKIADQAAAEIRNGATGVVVAHGTDTLAYTSAALSFALKDAPSPVVLVGAQRSSDRPSSDASSNLLASIQVAAQAPFSEVVLAMHDWVSDERIAIHRGTKVRKCHTSRRDAFRSVNANPIAYYNLERRSLDLNTRTYKNRHADADWTVHSKFNPNVVIIKSHPGLSSSIIDLAKAMGMRGIILEGTGLGHVPESFHDALQRAIGDGIVIGMCSQCLWGAINMNVYSAGRDLQRIGIIPLGDMLPETAMVKMMWALGQEDDPGKVARIMVTNIANELSDRRLPESLPEC